MVDWHYKRMDALAAISKRAAEDLTLPSAARELFLRAYHLARTLKHAAQAECQDPLDSTFTAMCNACKHANLHPCEPSKTSFQSCRLVIEQLS